jgi:predicted dinucleotide-binding enzyme
VKIGIIGSGMIGGTLADLLAAGGHEVALANRRGPVSLRSFAARHSHLAAVDVEETVVGTDLVVLAVPFGQISSLPQVFAGVAVVDATNYDPRRDGRRPSVDAGLEASSQIVADQLVGARVVKAFNTIYFADLRSERRADAALELRRALPISGDDAEAKRAAAELIIEVGFAPLDIGSLGRSGRQQPGSPLYNTAFTLGAGREIVAAVDRARQP